MVQGPGAPATIWRRDIRKVRRSVAWLLSGGAIGQAMDFRTTCAEGQIQVALSRKNRAEDRHRSKGETSFLLDGLRVPFGELIRGRVVMPKLLAQGPSQMPLR
jgi:hypothetical protein